MNLKEFLDVPFFRCQHWGICSKHFSPSSYRYPGTTQLCVGAEPPLSSQTMEEAVSDTIVEEIHMEWKKYFTGVMHRRRTTKIKNYVQALSLQEIISNAGLAPAPMKLLLV